MVEEPSDHEDIGLRGFDFNIFDEDEEGVVREEICGPYLKMLIKLWPGDWIDQLKSMNQKVDEDNGMQRVKGNVRFRKFVASQTLNSGGTSVVSFQHLHLVLEGRGCGKRKRNKS